MIMSVAWLVAGQPIEIAAETGMIVQKPVEPPHSCRNKFRGCLTINVKHPLKLQNRFSSFAKYLSVQIVKSKVLQGLRCEVVGQLGGEEIYAYKPLGIRCHFVGLVHEHNLTFGVDIEIVVFGQRFNLCRADNLSHFCGATGNQLSQFGPFAGGEHKVAVYEATGRNVIVQIIAGGNAVSRARRLRGIRHFVDQQRGVVVHHRPRYEFIAVGAENINGSNPASGV